MIDILSEFQLESWQWIFLFLSATFVGMAKTGVAGIYFLAVIFLAKTFGGQSSTGILLPILCMADIFAISFYSKSVKWSYVIRLFPWALVGVVLGTWVGDQLSDEWFTSVMGVVVLLGVILMIWKESRNDEQITHFKGIVIIVGLISGFTTMVGNAAGSVLAVYLLTQHLPKNIYIGTTAWFFFLINLTKIPFHVFAWKTISLNSLILDLTMLPAVAVGALFGVWVVKKIPEQLYRWLIIVVTGMSAIFLIM